MEFVDLMKTQSLVDKISIFAPYLVMGKSCYL